MPTEVLMPALSPTMEEGTLTKWLVNEGATVKAGDVIAEIETDKATMEVEAVDEGKLTEDPRSRRHRERQGQHADRAHPGRGRGRRQHRVPTGRRGTEGRVQRAGSPTYRAAAGTSRAEL